MSALSCRCCEHIYDKTKDIDYFIWLTHEFRRVVATDCSRDLHSDPTTLSLKTTQILAACHALVFVDNKTYENDAIFFPSLPIVKPYRLLFIHTILFGSFC